MALTPEEAKKLQEAFGTPILTKVDYSGVPAVDKERSLDPEALRSEWASLPYEARDEMMKNAYKMGGENIIREYPEDERGWQKFSGLKLDDAFVQNTPKYANTSLSANPYGNVNVEELQKQLQTEKDPFKRAEIKTQLEYAPKERDPYEQIMMVEDAIRTNERLAQQRANEEANGVDYLVRMRANAPTEGPTNIFNEFYKGFARASQQAGGAMFGALEMVSENDPYMTWLNDFAQTQADNMRSSILKTPELNRAKSTANFTEGGYKDPNYYANVIGTLLPHVAGALTSSVLGGMAAGPAGAVAGASAYSYGMESGSLYNDLLGEGYSMEEARLASAKYGAVAAALDSIIPAKVGGAVANTFTQKLLNQGIKQSAKKTMAQSVKEFGKDILIEAGTEASQELAQNITKSYFKENQDIWENVIDSFVGGALGGGMFGAIGMSNDASQTATENLPEEIRDYSAENGYEGQDAQNIASQKITSEQKTRVENSMMNEKIRSNFAKLVEVEDGISASIRLAEIMQEKNPTDTIVRSIQDEAQKELDRVKLQKQMLEKQYEQGTKVDIVATPEFTMSIGQTLDGNFTAFADLVLSDGMETLNNPTKYNTRAEAEIGTAELVQGYLGDKLSQDSIAREDIIKIQGINASLLDFVSKPNPQRMIRENRDVMLLAQDMKDYTKFEKAVRKNNLLPEGTDIAQFYDRAQSKEGMYITAREARGVVEKYAKDMGVSTEFVQGLTTPQGKRALGSFMRDERVIKLVTRGEEGMPDVEITTPYHEVGHAYFQTMMTPEERANVLQEIKNNSTKELTDKEAEEILVEDLRAYNDKKTLKALKKTIQPAYARLLDSIKEIVDKVLKWIGRSSEDKINQFYEDVLSMKRPSEKVKLEKAEELELFRTADESYLKEKALEYDTYEAFEEAMFSMVPEYAMSHRPSWEDAPSASNLLETDMLPKDVYNNPRGSISPGYLSDPTEKSAMDTLKRIRNNPYTYVKIYRAAPVNELNIGDWVSLSKEYADMESQAEGTPVWEYSVPAKDVLFAGDYIHEFGYFPKSILQEAYRKAHEQQSKKEFDTLVEKNTSFRTDGYRSTHSLDKKNITPVSSLSDAIIDSFIEKYIYEYGKASLKIKEVNFLRNMINNPDMDITIYRASPLNELNSGDWVTIDKTYANDIKRQNGGKVYSYEVSAKNLLYPKTVEEFENLPSLAKFTAFQFSDPAKESFRESPSSLEEEALKYDTVEEFMAQYSEKNIMSEWEDSLVLNAKNIREMYNPNLEEDMTKGLLSNLSPENLERILSKGTVVNDGKITVYRATIGESIKPGDYVTDNKQYAEEHLERVLSLRGESSSAKVLIQQVGLDELIDPSNNFVVIDGRGEFYYAPKYLQNITDLQLTDIYQKAHGESFRESPDLYHGTTREIVGDLQFPLYTTTNKEYASVFARSTSASSIAKQGIQNEISSTVFDLKLSPTAKILDIKNPEYRKLLEDEYFGKYSVSDKLYVGENGNIDWTEGQSLAEWIEETGKDFNVVILDEGTGIDEYGNTVDKGESYMILNKDALIKESFRENDTEDTAWTIPEKEEVKKSVDDALYEVSAQVEVAQAGMRIGVEDGTVAFESTFPKWVSPDNRSKELLTRASEYLDGRFRIPPKNSPRLRSAVLDLYTEVARLSDGAISVQEIEDSFDKVAVKPIKKRLKYAVFATPITAEDLQMVQDISDNVAKYSEVYSVEEANDAITFLKDAYQKERELLSRTGSPFPVEVAQQLQAVEEYALAGIEDTIIAETRALARNTPNVDVALLIPSDIIKNSQNVDEMVAQAREYNPDLGARLYEMDRAELERLYTSMKNIGTSRPISRLETVSDRLEKNIQAEKARNEAIVSRLTDARIKMVQMREARAHKQTERNRVRNVARMINLVDRKRIKDLENEVKMSDKQYLKDIYKAQAKGANAATLETTRILKKKSREIAKYKEMLGKVESLRKRVQASTRTGGRYYVEYARKLLAVFDEYDTSSLSNRSMEKLQDIYEMMYNNEKISDEMKDWYKKNIERVSKKSLRDMTYDELTELYDTLSALANKGAFELAQIQYFSEEEKQRRIALAVESTKNMDGSGRKGTTRTEMSEGAFKEALTRTGLDVLTPVAVMDKFDGTKNFTGWNAMQVRSLQKGEQMWYSQLHSATEELKTRIQEIKPTFTKKEETFLSLVARSREEADGAVKNLMAQLGVDIIPSQVEGLTLEQAEQIIDIIEEISDKYEMSTQLKTIFEARTNKPFPLKKHYVAPLKYTNRITDTTDADIEAMQNVADYGTEIGEGMAIARMNPTDLEVRTDLLTLVTEGWNHSLYYINMQPRVDNIQSVVGSKEFKEHAGRIVSKYWKEYLSQVANKGKSMGQGTFDVILRNIRQNFQVAILGFKATTVLLQPTAGFNAVMTAYAMHGTDTALSIMAELAQAYVVPSYKANALSQSEALTLRAGSAGSTDFAEINRLMETGLADLRGSYSKVKAGAIKAGMYMIQEVDIRTASAVRQGMYKALIARGVPEAKASADADFFMSLSQSSTQLVDRPLILSRYGEFGRLFFTFQTFTLGLWSMITQGLVVNGIIKGTPKVKIKSALAILAIPFFTAFAGEMISIVNNAIKGKEDDEDLEDKFQKALENTWVELVATVPLFGSMIKGKVLYNRNYEVPLVGTGLELIDGIQGLISPKDYDDFIKNLTTVGKSTSIFAGIPGAFQANDLINRLITTEKEKKQIDTRASARAYIDSGETNLDKHVAELAMKLYTTEEIKNLKSSQKTALRNSILKEVVRLGDNEDAKLMIKLSKNEEKALYLKELREQYSPSEFKDLVKYLKKYKILSEEAELLLYKK